MSIWRYRHRNEDQQSEFISDYPTKAYTKLDITSKLQVIQALDNGRCRADVAKEYGVHPQTVAYIYKQRDSILKKHNQKYKVLKEVCNLNLEQNLLEWFEQQVVIGNIITETQLRNKALEILKPISEEFTCIDDWLFSFRMRHNISKYTAENECNEIPKEKWKIFLKSTESKDVYLGGVCALAHNLDLNSYLNGQHADSYVSLLFIFNALGADKKEIAVVGKDSLESEAYVKSLPVTYYCCINSQVNYSVINSYLTKWDSELSSKGKYITLVLNIPDSLLRNKTFEHIKIVNNNDLEYVSLILDKIEECFKYHYRRLQISKGLTYGKDNCSYSEYIYMIGNAWYNVPHKYIQSICLPAGEGSLYFNVNDDSENEHSISQWCKTCNVQLSTEHCPSSLDKYVFCDKKLSCIYCGPEKSMEAVEVLNERESQTTSGMEAYQAMRRLVSYLQSESAGESIIKYAKYLENHTEYGALLQMHQIISSTNDSN